MTNRVLIKKSGTANAVPTAGDLLSGELAINYADGNLFYKNSGNVVTAIASNQFVSVSGNIQGANLNAVGLSLSGNVLSAINSTSNVTTTGNITGGNVLGGANVNSTLFTGTTVSVTGNITGGNVLGGANVNATTHTGTTVSVTGTITGASVVGGVITGSSTSVTGTVTGTAFTASANGTVFTANTTNAGLELGLLNAVNTPYIDFHSSGNATADYDTRIIASGGATNGSGTLTVTAATLAASAAISAAGNITGGNLIQGGIRVFKWTTSETTPAGAVPGDQWYIASTGKRYEYWNDGTGNVWVDQSQSTSFDALAVSGTATITGALTAGSVATASILNTAGNGVGNIGNATVYFNTVFAKSTSAQYADLAETYTADAHYKYGTVVIFGGEKEITVSNVSHDTRVAGVISKDPAHLMNSGATGLPVALTGRVLCQVRGPVQKGDILVNIDSGIAGRLDPGLASWGCVIGKSLDHHLTNDVAMIEIAVGRF